MLNGQEVIQIPRDKIRNFRRRLFRFYDRYARDLPFRNIDNPYWITVSELMLQQTQVDRILPKYEQWITQWTSWRALAKASRREVLAAWSGLGYNRRAIYLLEIARIVVQKYDGSLPLPPEELITLPGIGRYTAHAIPIFTFNKPLVAIDTNIRRVLIHEFKLPVTTTFNDLEKVAWQLLPRRRARDWHYALMDFGAMRLPHHKVPIPPISRQSRFIGSRRQVRGEIIRQLTTKTRISVREICRSIDRNESDVLQAVESLKQERMVTTKGRIISLVP